MSAEVTQVLRDALDRLDDGRSWIKGNFCARSGYCSLGALNAVMYDTHTALSDSPEALLLEVALAEYPDRQPAEYSIAKFNDHPDTTWADVERVFEKAIANADES